MTPPQSTPAPATPVLARLDRIRGTIPNPILRRLVVFFIGAGLILGGFILAPLPGPQLTVLLPMGVAVWATEFRWARRLSRWLMRREAGVRSAVDGTFGRIPRICIPAMIAAYWGAVWLLAGHGPFPARMVWLASLPAFTPVCYIAFRWHRARRACLDACDEGPAGCPGPRAARPGPAGPCPERPDPCPERPDPCLDRPDPCPNRPDTCTDRPDTCPNRPDTRTKHPDTRSGRPAACPGGKNPRSAHAGGSGGR